MNSYLEKSLQNKYSVDGLIGVNIWNLVSPHHIQRPLADQSINNLLFVRLKSESGHTGGQEAQNGHRGPTELAIISDLDFYFIAVSNIPESYQYELL